LGVLTNTGISELKNILPQLFTTASAISFLTFTLLYTPCVAAVATIKRELGSKLKTLGVVISQCVIAWIVAYVIYNIAVLVIG